MPEDPADYVRVLCELNLFETATFSAEDAQRADLYKQEAQRKIAETSASSFEDFLQSLEMSIDVSRFVPEQLGRITQLLQRSNQFNLTTHRYNQAQCEAMMIDSEGCIPLYAKLRDRFGDHGLISIVIARPDCPAGVLNITDWVMSCRVLTRGVEEFLMDQLLDKAKQLGLSTVAGSYIPTLKNGMVREFYARFGFEHRAEHSDGRIDWVLNIANYQPRRVFIKPETARAQAVAV
jgi:FkbH-like protein